jgi:hypothetical protein
MIAQGAVLLDNAGTLSQTHERVARLLKDYNPDLELQYIPEHDRTAFDAKPFRVVHNSPNGVYIIGHFAAKDVNHTLVAHVFKHDIARNGNFLNDLEAEEKAREALILREALDKHEEREDFAKHLIKSPLHTYRHNGKKYS